MNFLESVIAMNFSNTQHLILKWKVPTIAMNNPPVKKWKKSPEGKLKIP